MTVTKKHDCIENMECEDNDAGTLKHYFCAVCGIDLNAEREDRMIDMELQRQKEEAINVS